MDRSYVREIASDVAAISGEKETCWTYEIPALPAGEVVRTVAIGADGAFALFCQKEGWRQVMVGTISFYNHEGERLHTIYIANAPEKGKASFFERMEREVALVRERFPNANYVGIADGAHDQWEWLKQKTDWQILDFWHASEYVNAVAAAVVSGESAQKAWV
ncbi:MAG: ISKra4 family transposase, partial [Rhodobacteraceae bacterium]|nr:ISKra4 family transposase [Paracoccaceae bacterium]